MRILLLAALLSLAALACSSPEPTPTPETLAEVVDGAETPTPGLPTATPRPTFTPEIPAEPTAEPTPTPEPTPEPTLGVAVIAIQCGDGSYHEELHMVSDGYILPDPCPWAEPEPLPTHTPAPTYTPYPTLALPPTPAPWPTHTPAPTYTPYPVPTAIPTPTAIPAPRWFFESVTFARNSSRNAAFRVDIDRQGVKGSVLAHYRYRQASGGIEDLKDGQVWIQAGRDYATGYLHSMQPGEWVVEFSQVADFAWAHKCPLTLLEEPTREAADFYCR